MSRHFSNGFDYSLSQRYTTFKTRFLSFCVVPTIGTSQESADSGTIREFALANKRVGTDIHHIGDGSYGRMPDPENILALSLAIRGKRHTYFRMGQSVLR